MEIKKGVEGMKTTGFVVLRNLRYWLSQWNSTGLLDGNLHREVRRRLQDLFCGRLTAARPAKPNVEVAVLFQPSAGLGARKVLTFYLCTPKTRRDIPNQASRGEVASGWTPKTCMVKGCSLDLQGCRAQSVKDCIA